MRQIGTISNQKHAQRFADFMTTRGVSAVAEPNGETWIIWTREEDLVEQSRAELDRFLADPDKDEYKSAAAEATRIRDEATRRRQETRRNTVELRQVWNRPLSQRAPLTMTLIVLSVLLAIFTGFAHRRDNMLLRSLAFFDTHYFDVAQWKQHPNAFVDIQRGQVWRLITPVFIHHDVMHLVFNMFWLYALGGRIESRQGSARMAIIVLASAIAGNAAEMSISGPSLIGGMSGVAYGLFGYIWIRNILAPRESFMLSRETIVILVAVLVLGFAGVFRSFGMNIANWAHLFGMFGGMAVAYGVSWFVRPSRPGGTSS